MEQSNSDENNNNCFLNILYAKYGQGQSRLNSDGIGFVQTDFLQCDFYMFDKKGQCTLDKNEWLKTKLIICHAYMPWTKDLSLVITVPKDFPEKDLTELPEILDFFVNLVDHAREESQKLPGMQKIKVCDEYLETILFTQAKKFEMRFEWRG